MFSRNVSIEYNKNFGFKFSGKAAGVRHEKVRIFQTARDGVYLVQMFPFSTSDTAPKCDNSVRVEIVNSTIQTQIQVHEVKFPIHNSII